LRRISTPNFVKIGQLVAKILKEMAKRSREQNKYAGEQDGDDAADSFAADAELNRRVQQQLM